MQAHSTTVLDSDGILQVRDVRFSFAGLEYTLGACLGYAWADDEGGPKNHLHLVLTEGESHDLATYLSHQNASQRRLLASFSVDGCWIYGPGLLEFDRSRKAVITIRNCLVPLAKAS